MEINISWLIVVTAAVYGVIAMVVIIRLLKEKERVDLALDAAFMSIGNLVIEISVLKEAIEEGGKSE